MPIRINNVILDIEEVNDEAINKKALKKVRLNKRDIKSFKILRESIDARKKDKIKFNYTIEIECDNEQKIVQKINNKDVIFEKLQYNPNIKHGNKKLSSRPIVVGMGPAGMFAGLMLAENGYRPIIIERGQDVEKRTKTVNEFWESGKLDLNSNVQFGEGGAGTFSDGKLTTRIKDERCNYVLDTFVRYGAPNEIIYKGKPHIGTDNLKIVVKNIRKRIIDLGGEIKFNSCLQDIIIKDKKIKSIIVNDAEIECENLILCIGHSSRDTYNMLFNRGVLLTPKSFAIGVRCEHNQHFIDESQYGKYAGNEKLGPASYRLTYNNKKTNRSAYSFCMCPGGEVVCASSENERLVTNGMSFYKRDKENANSAIVVSVTPNDFCLDNPLGGIEFQRHYENLAYKLGGSSYFAPIQLMSDFIKDKKSIKLGNIKPTYKPGTIFAELKNCLPSYVTDTLKEAFISFDKKIHGFAFGDAVLTGIETRTSAPVRIERNEEFESISTRGLYPCGEGAGFAGGIISASVDGIKCAEKIINKYKNYD